MKIPLEILKILYRVYTEEEVNSMYQTYIEGAFELINKCLIRDFVKIKRISNEQLKQIIAKTSEMQDIDQIYDYIQTFLTPEEKQSIQIKIEKLLDKYDENIAKDAIETLPPEQRTKVLEQMEEYGQILDFNIEEFSKAFTSTNPTVPTAPQTDPREPEINLSRTDDF